MSQSKEAPIILFDLDRTMLDTGGLSEAIKMYLTQRYAEFGATLAHIESWSLEYVTFELKGRRTHYSPEGLIRYIRGQLAITAPHSKLPDVEVMTDDLTTFIRESVRQFLYNETLETLRQLSELGCVLCLFTQGVEAWQKLKLAHAMLEAFFHPTFQFVSVDKSGFDFLHYIQSVLEEKGLSGRNVWLVDDTKRIVENVKIEWPSVRAFLIDRSDTNAGEVSDAVDEDESQFETIQNLLQLVAIVRLELNVEVSAV